MPSKTLTLPRESEDGRAHLRQSRDSNTIRFYLWLYDANPSTINTCKLFWAYVFAPIALIFRLIVTAGIAAASLVPERKRPEPIKRKDPAQPSKAEAALDAVGTKIGAGWARFAPILRWVAIALAAAYLIAIAVVLIAAIIANPVDALIVVGIAVGILGVVLLALVVANSLSNGRLAGFGDLMVSLGRGVHNHTCAKIDLDEGPKDSPLV